MILEQWVHWNPIQDLAEKYLIEFINDTQEELDIHLVSDDRHKKRMRIVFKQPVLFYKLIAEFCTMDDIDNLRVRYGNEFIWRSSLFKVVDSKYLHFLKEESCVNFAELQPIHFVILDLNFQINVITTTEPLVEWIEHAS